MFWLLVCIILVILFYIGLISFIKETFSSEPTWKKTARSSPSASVSRSYTPADTARRIQNLSAVATFTDAVVALRANNTLSAHEKLGAIAVQYSESLNRLQASGQLTPEVAREFRILAERDAQAVTGLTEDFGAGLTDLIRLYKPPRRRFL